MTNAVHNRVPETKPSGATGNESFILVASGGLAKALSTKAARLLSASRIALTVQALVAIAIGIAVIIWPKPSLSAMVLVFVGYAVVDGLLSLGWAASEREGTAVWQGLVSFVAAAAALIWPDISSVALLYVLAVWVTVTALIRIRVAMTSARPLPVRLVLSFLSLLAVFGGVGALVSPGEGATSVMLNIGIFQVINGVAMLAASRRASR